MLGRITLSVSCLFFVLAGCSSNTESGGNEDMVDAVTYDVESKETDIASGDGSVHQDVDHTEIVDTGPADSCDDCQDGGGELECQGAGCLDIEEDEASAPYCGDGDCGVDDTCHSCPDDCALCCGNGECDYVETCETCPDDCGPCCGNGECDFEETCETCIDDCGDCSECGNGICDIPESCVSCPEDCSQDECCGDLVCETASGETCKNCPYDCGDCLPFCGDGILQEFIGEQCEDGNADPGDGCDEFCQIEPEPADPGSVIITEIMKNPAHTSDSLGEWFELYNTTADDIDINGWIVEDAGQDGGVLFHPDGIVIPAQSYLLMVADEDPAINGGLEGGQLYINVLMSNESDEVILRAGEVIVDQVVYDLESFPSTSGKSLSLDPGALTDQLNDLAENWCDAVDVYGDGDYGSPGVENPPCGESPECGDAECNGDETCFTCPGDCEECCGDGQCDDQYGEDCLTCLEDCGDCCGDGFCDHANGEDCLTCQGDCGVCCGNGDCESDLDENCASCPSDCGQCCPNGSCDVDHDESCGNCPQDCGLCCGDLECDAEAGESCQTCVLDCGLCPPECGNGTVEPSEGCDDGNQESGDGCSSLCLMEFAGELEPGMLVVTEMMRNPKLTPDLKGEWVEIMNISTLALDINGWTLKDADSDIHVIDAGGALVVEAGQMVVLGNEADPETNGGVDVDYQYSSLVLANDTDELMLVAPGGLVIDSVVFSDEEFPDTTGKAMSLDPEATTAAANDDGANWCDAGFILPGGDFGTPGLPNPGCKAIAVCGNSLVETGESCDDGNTISCDGCDETCALEIPSVCGNGVLELCEECDDGGLVPGDGCSAECKIAEVAVCGDGVVGDGEECDDGNVESLDGCSSDCQKEGECGNGDVDPGENCDDGNVENGDGCSATCDFEEAQCGNGEVEGPGETWPEGDPPPPEEGTEWCDDGNLENGDGCSADCMMEDVEPWICGNEVVEPYVGEDCDDGNTLNGDGCSQWCKSECPGLCQPCGTCCGDGFTTEGEQCDDGNLVDGDGCSSLCTYEINLASISGAIAYAGEPNEADTVWIMAFTNPEVDPVDPVGEPDHVEIVSAVFPLEYTISVASGTFYLGVVMDLGGDGDEGFGEEDFGVMYKVGGEVAPVVVGEGVDVTGIDVELTEPEGPELGSVSGVIAFGGEVTEEDSLFVYLSSTPSNEGQLDIEKETKYKPVQFPLAYKVQNVTPGAYYVVATFDKNDDIQDGLGAEGDVVVGHPNADGDVQILVAPGEDVIDIDIEMGP